MKKFIHVSRTDKDFIRRVFDISDRTVDNALRFDERRGGSATAKRVRRLALERGGVMMMLGTELETIHDKDGMMYQYLPNGASIVFHKDESAMAEVLHKGEPVRTYRGVKLSDIPYIQAYAAGLR